MSVCVFECLCSFASSSSSSGCCHQKQAGGASYFLHVYVCDITCVCVFVWYPPFCPTVYFAIVSALFTLSLQLPGILEYPSCPAWMCVSIGCMLRYAALFRAVPGYTTLCFCSCCPLFRTCISVFACSMLRCCVVLLYVVSMLRCVF